MLLNAASVFEIGIQIERNGKAFYQAMAEQLQEAETKAFFTQLAEWEEKHVALFQRLHAGLPEQAREDHLFDPDGEMAAYLKAAADTHVFAATPDMSALIAARCQSALDAVELALTFEKDSVVYYVTMKKVVAEHSGRDKIDLLIDEELHHIALLNLKWHELNAQKK